MLVLCSEFEGTESSISIKIILVQWICICSTNSVNPQSSSCDEASKTIKCTQCKEENTEYCSTFSLWQRMLHEKKANGACIIHSHGLVICPRVHMWLVCIWFDSNSPSASCFIPLQAARSLSPEPSPSPTAVQNPWTANLALPCTKKHVGWYEVQSSPTRWHCEDSSCWVIPEAQKSGCMRVYKQLQL